MLTETEQKTPHRWAVLGVLCAGLLMVGMDLTVLHVAVPTISRELLPSGSALLWIVDSYALTVAAGLIAFGTLGDRFGRKRMLTAGFVVFGLASAGAALSVTPGQLIAARAVLGVGGAMLMASTPALIRAVFPDDRERSVAIGLWTAANSVGVSVGPLLGGLLIEHFWWGAVFLVNVPIVVLAVVGCALLVPESRHARHDRWDAVSAGLSAVGLGTVVYAFQQLGERDGSRPVVWATGLLGMTLLIGFVVRQRRIRHPLLDIAQFADRRFSLSALCILGCYGAYTALLFLLTQRFQLLGGYSPLGAGLALVPLALANAAGAAGAPRFAARWGHRRGLSGGLVLCALALAACTLFGAANYVALVAAGLGSGTVMTLGSDAILGAAAPERAGEAGAVQETAFSLGAGLGVAVLGTVLSLVYRSDFAPVPGASAQQWNTARGSLGAATEVAARAGGRVGDALRGAAERAFDTGFAVATASAAVVLALLGVLAWKGLPESGRGGHH
ncbi:MFS transporter [Streptomyces tubercidicus]|uniref:MFS transporter n=1 Tax=Streptomyces tubercidicus TaxID=47759 RepID=A0A640UWQ8_9ACTN|nr:MFS transporter [Streptomyces tubercidicus]WAU14117.1 MFS transporter [Streptomyces tubercidicus]GFE39814.1 MFS transporter [Streptomyces tubercidicus]